MSLSIVSVHTLQAVSATAVSEQIRCSSCPGPSRRIRCAGCGWPAACFCAVIIAKAQGRGKACTGAKIVLWSFCIA